MACDTDGIDGIEDNAGAFHPSEARCRTGPDTARTCTTMTYRIFDAPDQLVVTGPTLTNVNDFRAILITGE